MSLADFHGNFILLYINIDLLVVKFVWLYIILLKAIVPPNMDDIETGRSFELPL